MLSISPNGCGFVRNIYVPKQLVDIENLKTGTQVHGIAIPSFDKKKQKNSIKCIYLKKKLDT